MDMLQAKPPNRMRGGWIALLALIPPTTVAAHLLQHLGPIQAVPLELELVAYGNTLLAASAALYLVRPVCHAWRLAPWASGLALAGAVELVWAALAAWPDGAGLSSGDGRRNATLLLAAAVIAYLLIESFYRDERTGVFVLPLVALAGGFQAQSLGVALHVSGGELVRLHGLFSVSCAAVLGYLLLAAGAALAASLLRGAARAETPPIGGRAVLDRAVHMVQANIWGVLVLGAACAGWEWWAYSLPREHVFLSPVEPWALAVLAAYTGHLFLLWRLRPAPRSTAGWATVLFGSSAVPMGAMLIASIGVFL